MKRFLRTTKRTKLSLLLNICVYIKTFYGLFLRLADKTTSSKFKYCILLNKDYKKINRTEIYLLLSKTDQSYRFLVVLSLRLHVSAIQKNI